MPSSPDCRVCIGTQSGCGNRSSKTSSALTTRSPPGIAAARQFSIVVLPACVPPATRMLRPARTEASRKAAAPGVRLPSSTRSCSRAGLEHELADVDGAEPAADALEDDVQPVALGQHRVDERLADVDPAPARLQHPLDQLLHLVGGEHQGGQLVPAVRGRRTPGSGSLIQISSTVGVVEEGLQRPEPGDPGHQLADDSGRLGHRRDRPGQAALVVLADHRLGDPAHAGPRHAAGRPPRGARSRARAASSRSTSSSRASAGTTVITPPPGRRSVIAT